MEQVDEVLSEEEDQKDMMELFTTGLDLTAGYPGEHEPLPGEDEMGEFLASYEATASGGVGSVGGGGRGDHGDHGGAVSVEELPPAAAGAAGAAGVVGAVGSGGVTAEGAAGAGGGGGRGAHHPGDDTSVIQELPSQGMRDGKDEL